MLRDLPFGSAAVLFVNGEEGHCVPTIIKVRDALSSVLNSAVRFEYLEKNPLELVVMPLDTYTGVRVSKLAALKWENVGEGSLTIVARYSKGDRSRTKTSSAATITVDEHVISRIHRLKTLTVDVRAGRAVRHHKVGKSANQGDLVFQSVWKGKEINADNIRKRFLAPAAAKLRLEN